MSRSKHTEAQMIAAVKQLEAGRKAEDVAREVGVSTHTIYAWKSKYGGMDASEAQEAKRLRDENGRLRKLVADLSLDKEALQSVIEKRMELAAMKASVEHIRQKFAFTERRACRLLLVPVSSYRYTPRHLDDGLRERLVRLAREKPRFGYRRLHVLLERQGDVVNHKRVHRIYREAGLALRRKKRKHCVRVSTPLGLYTAANQEWALDFVHDVLASGRSVRVLNAIDAYTRESLAMEVDTSFAGLRVTRVLDQIIAERGLPQSIRCDNGPEPTSRHFLAWALDQKIDLVHIQPGKPTQNAYVESFNSRLREECLRINWFQNLFEARRIIAAWRRDYNEDRPLSSLNYLTPAEFAR